MSYEDFKEIYVKTKVCIIYDILSGNNVLKLKNKGHLIPYLKNTIEHIYRILPVEPNSVNLIPTTLPLFEDTLEDCILNQNDKIKKIVSNY